MKKTIISFLKILSRVVFFMACFNTFFLLIEKLSKRLKKRRGAYYHWKYGDIFYKTLGEGDPLVMIHGLTPNDSGKDMMELAEKYAESNKVYVIDLLGFGLSSKPWITYTNYLYVLLIKDFIKDIAGGKAAAVATQGSCLSLLQAGKMFPECFGEIIIIDPNRYEKISLRTQMALKLKKCVDPPFVGSFLYNLYGMLSGTVMDREGRHVATSKLTGHLRTSITGHEDLITGNVTVYSKAPFADVSRETSLDD